MKIAITQNRIVAGGRLSVIVAMIKMLNKNGIKPDLVTFKIKITKDEIINKYGDDVRFNIKLIKPGVFKKLPELDKIFFNLLLNLKMRKYDLIINSNNTNCFLFNRQKVISYIHFPRKARFKNAELKLKTNLKQIVFDLEKILARGLYHTEKMDGLKIIANSNFTKKIIGQQFKISESQIEVIYPPVNIEAFFNSTQKKEQVVSIGRFMPDKLQLQQIQISKSIPYLDFHLIGFVSDSKESLKYFDECRNYISENNLKNVYLHPNCKFGKMKQIIFQSKYYLHMLEDEPFGITTVQAIAAGCIPIVPNSGGQIEIVPIEQLRWDTIQQTADIFNKIENNNIDHYKKELQLHIKQFGNEQFSKKFLKIFDSFGIDDKGGK